MDRMVCKQVGFQIQIKHVRICFLHFAGDPYSDVYCIGGTSSNIGMRLQILVPKRRLRYGKSSPAWKGL